MQTQASDSATERNFQTELSFDDRVQDARAYIRRWHSQARAVWEQSTPVQGTVGEDYLNSLHLTCPEVGLRFHPSVWHHEQRRHFPALVGKLVASGVEDDRLVAAAIVAAPFVDDTLKREASVVIGRASGRGVVLGAPASKMVVAADLECAIAAGMLLGQSAVSAAHARYFDQTTVPSCVQSLTIALDRTPSNTAARNAAQLESSFRRSAARDVEVRFAPPPAPFERWQDAARAGAVGVTA